MQAAWNNLKMAEMADPPRNLAGLWKSSDKPVLVIAGIYGAIILLAPGQFLPALGFTLSAIGRTAPFIAALLAMGVPLLAGLTAQDMSQGAAMSFVISGGVSSIPAALAVWALVKPRVFAAYIGFAFVGALIAGTLWGLLA